MVTLYFSLDSQYLPRKSPHSLKLFVPEKILKKQNNIWKNIHCFCVHTKEILYNGKFPAETQVLAFFEEAVCKTN